MLDLFFRAETPPTMNTVVRSVPFRNIIGDLRARDDDGGNIVSGIRTINGSVDWVYFAPGEIVITPAVFDGDGVLITPAVTDTWCWLHLRLTGPAEADDFEEDLADTKTDRWNKSRLCKWMRDNGVLRTIRGVKVFEHTLANTKRIQVWRGSEMESLGIKFHEFLGGSSF